MAMRNQEDKRAGMLRTIILVVIIFIVGSVAYVRLNETGGGASDAEAAALAQCLTEKGVKMYGAYWCSHCQAQKKLFGPAFSKVDYVECATPGNPRQQTKECDDAGIKGYPTWVFSDDSRLSGEVQLGDLAAKAGCPFGTVETPEPSGESVAPDAGDATAPSEPAGEQPAETPPAS